MLCFAVVWLVFGIAVVGVGVLADIDWNLVAAWAQVVTAFSFIGSGLVALAEVQASLRGPKPDLILRVDWIDLTPVGGRGEVLFCRVENAGSDPIHVLKLNVTCDRVPGQPAPALDVHSGPAAGWDAVLKKENEPFPNGPPVDMYAWALDRSLPARSGEVPVVTLGGLSRTSWISVSAWGSNHAPERWINPFGVPSQQPRDSNEGESPGDE